MDEREEGTAVYVSSYANQSFWIILVDFLNLESFLNKFLLERLTNSYKVFLLDVYVKILPNMV